MDLRLDRATTSTLPDRVRGQLRAFLDAAFEGDFSDHDFDHALGGTHVWSEAAQGLVAPASVVPRWLCTPRLSLQTGYVEAVATRDDARRRGLGSAVMRAVADILESDFEVGALSSSKHRFYAELGWASWTGPIFCAARNHDLTDCAAWVRTPDEDGGIMILRVPGTPELDLTAPLACDWRPGDVW